VFRVDAFTLAIGAALCRRAALLAAPDVTAYRVLDGRGDGVPGVSLDRYGPAAVLNLDEDAGLTREGATAAAQAILEVMRPMGLEAVYVKEFVRDRSRLGGRAPDEARAATPRAGAPQPVALVVREYDCRFEVRPYDGFSTGLFLDHREHRRALAERRPARVLNLFAYTCAFAVPLVAKGAVVTNVDVSARYLDWGRRNLALNGLDASASRFRRMDAFEYLAFAARHADERFDLVILDPPTFAAGDRRRGVKPWKAVDDYPDLVRAAALVVAPEGLVFAASNTRELAADGVLRTLVRDALGRAPSWQPLPPWPMDVTEPARVAAVLFEPQEPVRQVVPGPTRS
jgi:23S rRNA (cytosine1962-C5)-methyltransferase